MSPSASEDRWQEYATAAAVNAVTARDQMNSEAYVAGGMAGLGLEMLGVGKGTDVQIMGRDAYYDEFAEHAKIMADAGVEVILPEYMGYVEDCVVAVDASAEAGLPVWLGVRHVSPDRQMQYIESFEDLARALEGHPVDMVLLMCSSSASLDACLPMLMDVYDGPVGVYPNIGYNPMAMVGGRTRIGPDILSTRGGNAITPLPIRRGLEGAWSSDHRRMLRNRPRAHPCHALHRQGSLMLRWPNRVTVEQHSSHLP